MYCGCDHTAINLSEPNPSARAICPSCQMIMQAEMRERRIAYWLSVALEKLALDPMAGGVQTSLPAPLPAGENHAPSPAHPTNTAGGPLGLPRAVKSAWHYTAMSDTTAHLFAALPDDERASIQAANPSWNSDELVRVRWTSPTYVPAVGKAEILAADVSSPYPAAMLHDAPPVDTLKAELAAQRDEIASLKAALVAAHERSKDEGRLERAEDR